MSASHLNSAAQATASNVPSPATLSAFTQGAGTNRRALVFITAEDDDTSPIDSVTWGGVSMTQIAQALQGATFNQRVTAFELLESELPADGNVDIVLSFDDTFTTQAFSIEAMLCAGVHQNAVNAAQITVFEGTSTTTAVLDNAVTSAATHFIAAAVTFNGEGTTLTQPADFTEVSDHNIGSGVGGHSGSAYKIHTGSSETVDMDYVNSASGSRVAGLSISYGEASAGGSTYTLTAEQGAFTLSGQATGLSASRIIDAAQGSFALTGQAVDLAASRVIQLEQGVFALTGQAALLPVQRVLEAGQGTFTLSGQDAGLLASRLLAAGQGAFAMTGNDVALTLNQSEYTLTADLGSFTLGGQDVALARALLMALDPGSYSLNGQDAGLTKQFAIVTAQGTYALTGQDTSLLVARVIQLDSGSFVLTGQAVLLPITTSGSKESSKLVTVWLDDLPASVHLSAPTVIWLNDDSETVKI